MKANLVIGLIIGVMACATAGTFGAVSAREEAQWDAVSTQEKSQWDGVYSDEQAMRGQALYAQHCSSCHGPELSGGEMAPSLAGGDFAANWNDVMFDQLFDRIRLSMPQNNPGSLSRQQTVDILAFMLNKSGAPAGAAELSTQSEILNTIKYFATNPRESE